MPATSNTYLYKNPLDGFEYEVGGSAIVVGYPDLNAPNSEALHVIHMCNLSLCINPLAPADGYDAGTFDEYAAEWINNCVAAGGRIVGTATWDEATQAYRLDD